MERQTELSPRTKKYLGFLGLVIATAITIAIVIVIFLGVAAYYRQLF